MKNNITQICVAFLCHVLLVACSTGNHEEKMSASTEKLALTEMFVEEKAHMIDKLDPKTGWLDGEDCDMTLWAGELSMAGVEQVNIKLAVEYNGRLQRKPGTPCWPKVEGRAFNSDSECSNDMALLYIGALWRARDLKGLQDFADYGEKHFWIMCEPYPEMASRVVLKTNQIGLLGRMIYALSNGSDDRFYRTWFQLYLPVVEDYEQHIQAVGILLQGEVDEYLDANSLNTARVDPDGGSAFMLLDINDNMLGRLKDLAAKSPDDALFAGVLGVYTGDMSRATDLLLSDNYTAPSYVRGHDDYKYVHWLFVADIVLRRLA